MPLNGVSIPLEPRQADTYGVIAVTPHYLSTHAALWAMDQGGNAVDAAIAANATQGVVAPETCGVGGDLFALIHQPGTASPAALNASGRAGSGADSEALRRSGLDTIPQTHPAAVSVPGCVDGWIELSRRFGRLDLARSLEPAIRLAEQGFPSSIQMETAFTIRAGDFASQPGATEMYRDGVAAGAGSRITRPVLARLLSDVGRHGRSAFYEGAVAEGISRAVEGMITADDLASSHPDWVEPISADVYGLTAWTVPPNSQGYIALLASAVFQLVVQDPGDERAWWHLAIEAARQATAERSLILSDPESSSIDVGALLAPSRIAELADRIDPDRALPAEPRGTASGGTAYMCVTDAEGVGVSLIQSNYHGIGSSRAVPEGGFILQDRGRGFTLKAGHPNELRPGRRPMHTLSPTLWTREGSLDTLLGTRGGDVQPQLIMQLAASLMGRSLSPGSAMALPRWTLGSPRERESRVEIEPGTPDSVVSGLQQRGHVVETHSRPQPGWGPMSVIRVSAGDLRTGAADPRVDTASVGVG